MDNLWLAFYWSGPIGVGIFLVCLSTFIWLLTKADILRKSTLRKEKDKE